MLCWQDVVSLPDEHLTELDIAKVNLACTEGLPGCANIDVAACLYTLDTWAERVRCETDRLVGRFRANPFAHENSWAYFRTLVLITVLQRDLGVRYHPYKTDDDAVFEPSDVFIHGIIQGEGGTCASLPVIWAAVGRRLGYPIRLVAAAGHLFARWDDPCERFNIEASGKGLTTPSDDYYREGRYHIPHEYQVVGQALKSLTPREELANFLAQRGYLWLDRGNYRKAVKSFAWASALAPENKWHTWSAVDTLDSWKQMQKRRVPSASPSVTIQFPPPQFQNMPRSIEQEMIATEVLEDLLDDKGLNARLAGPQPPKHVFVEYPSAQLWRA